MTGRTRTLETEKRYVKQVSALRKAYERSEANENKRTVDGFVAFLAEKASGWKPRTWRLRRAALKYYLDTREKNAIDRNNEKAVKAIRYERDLIMQIVSGTDKEELSKPKTSSKKAKKIPLSKLIEIQDKLSESNSIYASAVNLMLVGSIICGARPSEWLTASIIKEESEGYYGILLENAKRTNGRSCGKYRTVWFAGDQDNAVSVCEATINEIKNVLSSIEADNEDERWEKFYANARKLLRRSQEVKPDEKTTTLYSGRHQFIADKKMAKYTLEEIAALVGHISIRTSVENYGKKSSGRGSYKVIANKSNLDRVKEYSENKGLMAEDVLRMTKAKKQTSEKIRGRND